MSTRLGVCTGVGGDNGSREIRIARGDIPGSSHQYRGWWPCGGDQDRGPAHTLQHFVERTLGTSHQLARPGEVFSYNNAGWGVAGRVIEVVTGMSIGDALAHLVFEPLGLARACSR
jgi:CubicO group peptidase (beta-lactamase class C family)